MPQKKRVKRLKPTVRAKPRHKAMLSMVKQVVLKNQETKMASTQYSLTAFNSSVNSSGDFITVLPSILQGTGQGGRVGASLKPVKLVIRGYITYKTDFVQGARMLGTRLFCFGDKSQQSYPVITAAGPNYQLLDVGGSATAFTGQAIQYMMPHNTDLYKWFADKKHVIRKPFGYTNSLSPTATTDITGMDSSLYKPFTITIPASKMPSQLKYDDTLSTGYPVNFAPLIGLGYCDLLGYSADTTLTQISMEFIATLYYKDA